MKKNYEVRAPKSEGTQARETRVQRHRAVRLSVVPVSAIVAGAATQ
jgi:hypothetical protein